MSDAVLPTPSRPVLRPWRTPVIAELPKLSALTLASAIGGGGGTSGGGSTVFTLLLALGLAFGVGACTNDRTLGGEPTEGPAPVGQLVTCVADRATLALDCRSPEAAPGTGTFGGQGTKVGLRSWGVSYDGGTSILSAKVTVQNLGALPIGTIDGTTPSPNGVRVFFIDPPSAAPTGTVSVNNATGTATFTAGSQAYYQYPGMLASLATSDSLTWEFHFAGGATSFTFSVLVSADLPAVGAIRRWAEEPGRNPVNWTRISGWGSDGLALFGQYGEVYLRDAGIWSSHNDPSGQSASRGAVGVGPNDLTVMTGGNRIRHWDGSGWRAVDSLPGGPGAIGVVGSVGGSGKTGACAFGFWQKCFTGSTWSDITVTGSPNVAASTVIDGDIVVLTTQGAVWARDSASGVWTQIGGTGSGQNQGPGIIFGNSLTSIWTISTVNNTDPVIRYWNGTAWATQPVPSGQENNTGTPRNGAAISATEAYIVRSDFVGHGHVWQLFGGAWFEIKTDPFDYSDLWARPSGEIYVAAVGGRVFMDSLGFWSDVLIAPERGRSIWVLGASNAFLGTEFGNLLHYDGTEWETVFDLGGEVLSVYAANTSVVSLANAGPSIWYSTDGGAGWTGSSPNGFGWWGTGGSGPHDLWFVGDLGQIFHLDPGVSGGFSVNPGDLTSEKFNAVWAYSPSFAVAVGVGGTIAMWNGSAWSLATSPTGNALHAVSGTSASDVWAVGDGGVVLHYNGTAWSGIVAGGGQNLNSVWAASPTEVYAVGNNKTVLMYNGTAWSAVAFESATTGSTFYGVHGFPGGQALIAGDRILRGTR